MARKSDLSVSEDGRINTHVIKRQNRLLNKVRECDYVLDRALNATDVPRSTFLRWYQEDTTFRENFDALEDEQIPLMRQTLREVAMGKHPTSDGKPDKTILRYLVGEYDKRHGNEPEDSDHPLSKGLEGLRRDDLAKIAG